MSKVNANSFVARIGTRFVVVGWLLIGLPVMLGPIWFRTSWSNGKACLALIAVGLMWTILAVLLRTRCRFGMKTLLMAMTLVAILCAAIGREVLELRAQRRATAGIVQAGGMVWYGHEPAGDGWSMASGRLPLPDWLLEFVGEDVFAESIEVTFETPGLTDAELSELDFRHVQVLAIHNQAISDASLRHLGKLSNLRVLILNGTGISDTGLAYLRELTNLSILRLRNNGITDAGLEQLRQFKRLRFLHLGGTSVTQNGVRRLQAELVNCKIDR